MATELENLVPEADVEVEGMRGPKGDKGDSYVLTEADKEEIARKVDKIIDSETDKTLSISGKPADAKAAGDAIDDLKADLTAVEDDVDSLKTYIPITSLFSRTNNLKKRCDIDRWNNNHSKRFNRKSNIFGCKSIRDGTNSWLYP